MSKKVFCVMAVVALACAGQAFAQCANPSNILTPDQCSFDNPAVVGSGLGFWEAVPYSGIPFDPTWGVIAHSTTGGYTSPATIVGTPDDNGPPPFGWGWTNAARLCLNHTVAIGEVYGFGVHVNVTSGAVDWCNVMATTMSGPTCDGGLDFANYQTFTVPGGSWHKVNETDAQLTITQAADYIELRIACAGPATYSINYDNMYLGLNMVPVELQSFSVE